MSQIWKKIIYKIFYSILYDFTFHIPNIDLIPGTTFCVDERYEYIKQIGLGAYGVVCSCFDKKTNMKVAIKKVPNAFEDLIDAKRILREIKLLKYFDHENIISLLDVPKPEARTGYNDIYIVTDLMETDLHRVIYSKQVNFK